MSETPEQHTVFLRLGANGFEFCSQEESEDYHRALGVSEAELQRVRQQISEKDSAK